MSKQRMAQLLSQLEINQQQDLKNAAAIYATAQVAVNQLAEPDFPSDPGRTSLRLPPSITDKSTLLQRYGSYNNCRKAAKALGITFVRTPSWAQLTQALGYAEALQNMAQSYLSVYPCPILNGVTIQVRFAVNPKPKR